VLGHRAVSEAKKAASEAEEGASEAVESSALARRGGNTQVIKCIQK
jgi:hypothetical protein